MLVCPPIDPTFRGSRDRSGAKTVKRFVEETRSEKLCVKGEESSAEGCCLKELDSREGGGG